MSLLVAEAYILEFHLAMDRWHLGGTFRIFHLYRFINGLEDPLQVGDGGEQGIVESCQGVDRCPEASYVGGEGDEHTYRQCGIRRQDPADAQHIDEGRGDGGNDVHRGPHGKVELDGIHPGPAVVAAQVVEDLVVLILPDEGLGHPDAIDALGNIGVQVALFVGLDLPGPALFLLNKYNHGGKCRQAAEAYQCEPGITEQHEQEDEDQVAQVGDGVDDPVAEQVA